MKLRSKIILGLCIIPLAIGLGQDNDASPTSEMQTKVYDVPPNFVDFINHSLQKDYGGTPYDPFTESTEAEDGTQINPDDFLQTRFKKSGVAFEEGASATFDEKTLRLTVTNTPEAFELIENILEINRARSEKQIVVFMEYIEVDHTDFSDWLFENVLDNNGTELRNVVQKWIKDGKAEIIESATVTARSGQRAKTESIEEYSFPQQYHSAEIPDEVTLKDSAEAPITPVTPSSFGKKNLGTTLEVDPILGADDFTIDLNLSPELVELVKVEQWNHKDIDPKFRTHFPTFYIQKLTTQITCQDGRYAFLGATRPRKAANPNRKNPFVLQFVRADVAALGDWFEVKPDKPE